MATFSRFDAMAMRVAACEAFRMPLHHVKAMPYRDFVQCLVVAEVQASQHREQRRQQQAHQASQSARTRSPGPLPRRGR